MIRRSNAEYMRTRERLLAATNRLREHEARMHEQDLTAAEIKRALDPLRCLSLQLREEIETHERRSRAAERARHG